jgi:hypothetical protein
MVFTSRGIRIGIAGQDDFGKLLATGLSFTIALQVFIMVGGVTRSSRSRVSRRRSSRPVAPRSSRTGSSSRCSFASRMPCARAPGGDRLTKELRRLSIVMLAMFVALFGATELDPGRPGE